ncbi:hypothetical protein JMUB7516_27210 [Staphylococcus aureus]
MQRSLVGSEMCIRDRPNGLVVNHNSKYFNDLNALYISIIVSIIIFAIVTFLNNKKSWRLK